MLTILMTLILKPQRNVVNVCLNCIRQYNLGYDFKKIPYVALDLMIVYKFTNLILFSFVESDFRPLDVTDRRHELQEHPIWPIQFKQFY
jgi:hypothetical protein